jgi:hypothetical protein
MTDLSGMTTTAIVDELIARGHSDNLAAQFGVDNIDELRRVAVAQDEIDGRAGR